MVSYFANRDWYFNLHDGGNTFLSWLMHKSHMIQQMFTKAFM